MKISDLNDKAINKLTKTLLDEVVEYVKSLDVENRRFFLEVFVSGLNQLDEDDFFGSEGWKHYFNVE